MQLTTLDVGPWTSISTTIGRRFSFVGAVLRDRPSSPRLAGRSQFLRLVSLVILSVSEGSLFIREEKSSKKGSKGHEDRGSWDLRFVILRVLRGSV
jgi:hypothetical protein